MVHNLFPDFGEACILCQVRDVAVHLAINLDVLHHLTPIGFQSTVEVVQVMYARDSPRRRIEKLCRNRFRQGVVTFLLVSRHQVVTLFRNHAVEFGNLVGTILQISVHGDDHIAFRLTKPTEQRRRLSIVPAELDTFHTRRFRTQTLDDLPGTVGTSVIDKNDLIRKMMSCHHPFNPGEQFRQRFLLIVERNDNGYIHNLVVRFRFDTVHPFLTPHSFPTHGEQGSRQGQEDAVKYVL